MKTVVNISEKISHQPFGSFGASCSFELEIDQAALQSRPDDVLAQIRFAADLCRAAVTRELELTRQKAGALEPPEPRAARDAGDDFDDQDDVAPGDRGYREPSRRGPERDRGHDRGPDRRPERRDRSEYRRGGSDDGPEPANGKQFAGWLSKQDDDTKDRVRDLMRSWDLPGRYLSWRPDDVRAVYHELTGVPDSGRSWPGSGGGRNNGYRH
jgi:hypothetical protein